jgi:hypothetical protein
MKTNKHSIFFTLALCLVLLTSCASSLKYHSNDIIEITSFHHKIAVLPIDGLKPKLALEYQKNVYDALMSKNRKTVKISVQKFSETNQILAKANIPAYEAFNMKPQQLARLLGVDAILKLRVEPDTLIGQTSPELAFSQFGTDNEWLGNLFANEIASSVRITAAIFDTQTGEKFWEYSFVRKLKSFLLSQEDFEDTSLKIAKNFPYKWE